MYIESLEALKTLITRLGYLFMLLKINNNKKKSQTINTIN